MDRRVLRAKLDLLQKQDRAFSEALGKEDGVESAIQNYEMAFWMQALVPDVLDLGRESEATKSSTASIRRSRPNGCTARSACGPGGWSSPECASSKSAVLRGRPTAPGTSTAT
jgi:hypothetical protein